MTPSESAVKRYSDAYKASRSMAKAGGFLMVAGLVIGAALFIAGLIAGSEGEMLGLFLLWLLAGFVALLGYGLGEVVAAQGQILSASLDNAVNTSPFLSEGDRVEVMSLAPQKPPWCLIGIRYASPAEPIAQFSPPEPVESRTFESPVAALISNGQISPSAASAPRSAARRRSNAKALGAQVSLPAGLPNGGLPKP